MSEETTVRLSREELSERLKALKSRYSDEEEWRRVCVAFSARCAWRVLPLYARWERASIQLVEPALLVASMRSVGVRGAPTNSGGYAAAARAAAADQYATTAAYAAETARVADQAAATDDYVDTYASNAATVADDADAEAVARSTYGDGDTAYLAAAASFAVASTAVVADLNALESTEMFDGRRLIERPLWPAVAPEWSRGNVILDAEVRRRYEGFLTGKVDWADCEAAYQRWCADQKLPSSDLPREKQRTASKMFERTVFGNHGAPDQPTGEDKLGYAPLAKGVAEFLAAEKTAAPFTLSVEGEWGCGKSSFLLQVKKQLGSDAATVWFNPWRHDAGESMWAAFAVALTESLRPKGWLEKKVATYRYRRSTGELGGWGKIAALVGVAVLWMFVGRWLTPMVLKFAFNVALVDTSGAHGVVELLKWALVTGFHLGILFLLFRTAWNKLGLDALQELRALSKEGDYAAKVSAIERFQRNFGHLVRAYAPKAKKIYVFVDDLDRCTAPRAGELLESIALVMSGDADKAEGTNLPLVFILALDREKVAAGVAVKHANVLPYLQAGRETKLSLEEAGIRFGYEYLEKFIQVPFRLPGVRGEALSTFITALAPTNAKLPQPTLVLPKHNPVPEVAGAPARAKAVGYELPKEALKSSKLDEVLNGPEKSSGPTAQEVAAAARDFEEKEVDGSGLLQNALRLAAPSLGNNPRRMKQYQNLLRLRLHLGSQFGVHSEAPVTPTQLAKLVMIEIARPTLHRALFEHHEKREAFLGWGVDLLDYWMHNRSGEVQAITDFAKDDNEWLKKYWPDIHYASLTSISGEEECLNLPSLEWLLHLGVPLAAKEGDAAEQ